MERVFNNGIKGFSYKIGSTQPASELVKRGCKLELQGDEIFGEVMP